MKTVTRDSVLEEYLSRPDAYSAMADKIVELTNQLASCSKSKTVLINSATSRDGGTRCIDQRGKYYFQDFRIGSRTRGNSLLIYPNDKEAEMVDSSNFILTR